LWLKNQYLIKELLFADLIIEFNYLGDYLIISLFVGHKF